MDCSNLPNNLGFKVGGAWTEKDKFCSHRLYQQNVPIIKEDIFMTNLFETREGGNSNQIIYDISRLIGCSTPTKNALTKSSTPRPGKHE
jgi:hypothetical protein